MKNHKLLYLLIPLSLFIWGMIVYKIVYQVKISDDLMSEFSNENSYYEKQVRDTFLILANYSDPFLERTIVSSVDYSNSSNIRLNDAPQKNMKLNISWPAIRYGGMIQNESINSFLYLVQIDNVNHLVRKGDQVGSIRILKVFRDSITVQIKHHTKTILKENL